MNNLIPFQKEYQHADALVQLLLSRGLAIDNPGKAEQYLKTINYYRLSAYMYPLLLVPKSEHRFKTDASFRQVMMLYRFDKKLRLFMFNEIEKIEIAVRTAIVDECTSAFFWLLFLLSILHQWDFQRGGRTRNCGKSGKLKQKIKNIPKSL